MIWSYLYFAIWRKTEPLFCTQCQGRGVPLLWLDPVEQMNWKGLQGCSQRLLWLCAVVQMVTHQHQLLCFLSFLLRCYTIPVFFIDMHFSEMLRKLCRRVFWGQSYLTHLTFFGIRVWTSFRTKSLLSKWVVLWWGDLQLQVPFFSILAVKR